MAHVHFFLNPKGGTGKSLVSYIVAQYLISKGVKTTCIDCDPVTPTLIAYEALHAVRVNIMVENNIDNLTASSSLLPKGRKMNISSSTTAPAPLCRCWTTW